MAEAAGSRTEVFHGLPARRLSLPQGDTALVLLHGAQLVSWISGGRERLYLSPWSQLDGRSAVRGGVPICFPQFNLRGPLPKHGFARNLPWQPAQPPAQSSSVALALRLSANAATMALWPQAFEASVLVELSPACLRLTLEVNNTGLSDLQFTGALHSYLRVDDVSKVEVRGLEGQAEWDALSDQHGRGAASLRFPSEFDRVFEASRQPLVVHEDGRRLEIAQSPSWRNTVVWNPGADKCAALQDMPRDGYAHMLCVEAAQVMQSVTVPVGGQWQGWQSLTVK